MSRGGSPADGGKPERKGAWSAGLTAAIRGLDHGRRGEASEADAPKLSTLPMTPAAREALRLSREKYTPTERAEGDKPSAGERIPPADGPRSDANVIPLRGRRK